MASLTHLAGRFLESSRPGSPDRADEQWALTKLTAGERILWARMGNPDRRHAVGVAKRVAAELGGEATRPVLAAALLHDVGKVVSGLRTPARVLATLVWAVVPPPRTDVASLGRPSLGWWLRLVQYRRHPELGEALLRQAGSDPMTSAWAADHHRPSCEWRIEQRLGAVLKACDGD